MTRRLLLIAVAAVAAACSDNRSSIEIVGRAAPDSIPDCKFTGGGTGLLGPGLLILDTASGDRTYQQALYVTNQLVDPSKANTANLKSAKAWRALAAKIRVNPSDYLKDFPPAPDLLGFSRDARVPLDGNTIDVGTNGVQFVPMIPQGVGDAINGLVAANGKASVVLGVTLEGQTLDGASLDTGEWYFGLNLCKGTGCPAVGCVAPDVPATCGGFGGLNAQQDPLACVTP